MAWISLLDIIYPVGSIYITVLNGDAANPANLIGGTWTALYNTTTLRNYIESSQVDGQAPLGEWGGRNYIEVENMPSHTHNVTGGAHQHAIRYTATGVRRGSYWQLVTTDWDGPSSSYMGSGGSQTHSVAAVGGGREALGGPYLCPHVEARCLECWESDR